MPRLRAALRRRRSIATTPIVISVPSTARSVSRFTRPGRFGVGAGRLGTRAYPPELEPLVVEPPQGSVDRLEREAPLGDQLGHLRIGADGA